ncbi:uncharacterized protein LOC129225578 isoform X1 [Uloborus diversus]|uniref:uncharacterized protein LOC129225578 isoform X1 n=1 Tax=Uloborus diversus TaxID=327109 RepID=UPI00240A297C|nr:uncharacterized protein LOC129225578 isoform X1 [Uloborus diversus]XP_054716004.1 uncharacterized protein LOC129225578 isoform X1 [Uloborus diversus]
MSFNISHAFMTFFGVLLLALIVRSQDYSMEEDLKKLIARRKGLDIVREVISDFDNNLGRIARKACLLRLPGFGCDFPGFVPSIKDRSIFGEDTTVNKKRSYSDCEFKVGNPEGCLGKLVDGERKDNDHWGDPNGPGKK